MKKEDIELLKLAAKAAGMYYDPTVKVEGCLWVSPPDADCQSHQVPWNPLIDDGDNHRMETQLKLEVRWHEDGVEVGCRDKPFSVFCFFAEHNNDENAARRMASTEMASKL